MHANDLLKRVNFLSTQVRVSEKKAIADTFRGPDRVRFVDPLCLQEVVDIVVHEEGIVVLRTLEALFVWWFAVRLIRPTFVFVVSVFLVVFGAGFEEFNDFDSVVESFEKSLRFVGLSGTTHPLVWALTPILFSLLMWFTPRPGTYCAKPSEAFLVVDIWGLSWYPKDFWLEKPLKSRLAPPRLGGKERIFIF